MSVSLILFLVVAVIAVVTALGMLFSRNAVYSALYLILNFASVAVLYLQLNAPFIAVAQVTVYAGAIMVLFLFAIMLLGAESTGRQTERPWWFQPLPLFLGGVLLAETVVILISQMSGSFSPAGVVSATFGDPASIGELLFSRYLLPFEATSILLLVAMIGAIVLTRSEKK